MKCRFATIEDIRITYEWACDILVRDNSFNQSTFSLEDHKSWFLEKINSEDALFLIFESDDKSRIGIVRFEIKDTFALIGITVAPLQRGKGYASEMLVLALKMYSKNNDLPVFAYIKDQNIASIKAFEKAGFQFEKTLNYKQVKSKMFVWK